MYFVRHGTWVTKRRNVVFLVFAIFIAIIVTKFAGSFFLLFIGDNFYSCPPCPFENRTKCTITREVYSFGCVCPLCFISCFDPNFNCRASLCSYKEVVYLKYKTKDAVCEDGLPLKKQKKIYPNQKYLNQKYQN